MKRKGFLKNVIKIRCLLNRKEHKVVTTCFFLICICSRFFEDQPNENCSYFNEKASKGMFFYA